MYIMIWLIDAWTVAHAKIGSKYKTRLYNYHITNTVEFRYRYNILISLKIPSLHVAEGTCIGAPQSELVVNSILGSFLDITRSRQLLGNFKIHWVHLEWHRGIVQQFIKIRQQYTHLQCQAIDGLQQFLLSPLLRCYDRFHTMQLLGTLLKGKLLRFRS